MLHKQHNINYVKFGWKNHPGCKKEAQL